ncbi:MAG: DUF2769 domain-containing protein [Euryarchaeota archaeon]|nr:DUF2769 domain-containing protein [Euryarchaeota archaeon]
MDRFEKAVEAMSKKTKGEGKHLNADLRDRCECPACPTYVKCARQNDEKLFCFWGESDCISGGQTCICPSCTVWQEMGMKNRFYCIDGPEIVQRETPKNHKDPELVV